ncbi:XRE family transcriptional regulator, partial [Pseudoalteromonas ruthenica]
MLDGSDLKSVRKNAGISQTDMANKLNCDRRTIINYEQGVCEPKSSQLFRWLDVC